MSLSNVRLGKLCLLLMGFLCSCQQDVPTHNEVFVLVDQTGSFAQDVINADETIDFIATKTATDLSKLTSNSFKLTIAPLTDLQHNKQVVLSLSPGDGILGEVQKKRLEKQHIFREATKEGINIMKNTGAVQGSQLILPLCEKLRLLSTKTADKKLVILFSDLFEHSKRMSFYSSTEKEIKEQLQKQCNCGDLTGIEVYCIYQTDSSTDEQFGVIRKAFKAFVEEANGSFTYLPNL